jgi:thiol-disulfide isomerase/thioredoxin
LPKTFFLMAVATVDNLREEVPTSLRVQFILLLLLSQLVCLKVLAADSTFVEGKLMNQYKQNLISFYVDDFVLGNQNTYVTETGSDGSFAIGFPLRHTQDVLVSFEDGHFTQLILSPNDRLWAEFGVTSIFRGKNAAVCQNIEAFNETVDTTEYQELERAYSLEFTKYADLRDQYRKREIARYDSFCSDHNCSLTFRDWYRKHSNVRFIVDVTNYGWKSPQPSNKSSATSLAFLEERLDVYDTSYQISSLYRILVNNLSWSKIRFGDPVALTRFFKAKVGFLADHQSELTQEETLTLNKIINNFSSEEEIDSVSRAVYWHLLDKYDEEVKLKLSRFSFQMLIEETSNIQDSNLRDLLICKYTFGRIENNNDRDFAFHFTNEMIVNKRYRDILKEAYLLAGTGDSHIAPAKYKISTTSRDSSGQELLNEILTSNKGKLIILDFWATWCAPCRNEFKVMNELKPTLPNEIAYIYLCCQSASKADCQKVIDKYEIEGQHFFLNDRQYIELQQQFQIHGFPTYVVLEKNGTIHRNFVSPSNSKIFALTIGELFGH